MADEPREPDVDAEAAAREERIKQAAEKIAKEDDEQPGGDPEEGQDIAGEAARAGLEQAHRSAFTHP